MTIIEYAEIQESLSALLNTDHRQLNQKEKFGKGNPCGQELPFKFQSE